MKTINFFCTGFEEPAIQDPLRRLYEDLGNQDKVEWSRTLYLTLRNDPNDSRVMALNVDRKTCLTFLYHMVDAWESSADPRDFQQGIQDKFGIDRVKKILKVCMVMDRAQSLYRMQIPTSSLYGMHWYSKLHLEESSEFALTFPDNYKQLKEALRGYKGFATMNRRLYKLMYTKDFALMQDAELALWSKPALAKFVPLTENLTTTTIKPSESNSTAEERSVEAKRASPTRDVLDPPSKSLKLDQEPFVEIVTVFVKRYNEPDYQECLARLYHDRSSRDPEEWAMKLYLDFRDDPSNERAITLNQDRKKCLNLVYDLVNEWEKTEFSTEFEYAIKNVFKPRRLVRIFGVCLVMDRAQSLYKMILPERNDKEELIIGMHWFSILHFENDSFSSAEEREDWIKRLEYYGGTATMNKRLYRLLYSKVLNLQDDPVFAKWAQPQLATFEYRPVPIPGD